MSQFTFLNREHVSSIREIQRNPSKALREVTRVVRGSKTMGFYLANDAMDELLEDMEALASRPFRARVRAARRELRAAGGAVTLATMAKRYGV